MLRLQTSVLPCKPIYKAEKYLLLLTLLTFYGGSVCSPSFCKPLSIMCSARRCKKKGDFFPYFSQLSCLAFQTEKPRLVLFISQPPYMLHEQKRCLGPGEIVIGFHYRVYSFTGLHTFILHYPFIVTNGKKSLKTENGFRKRGNFSPLMA